MRENNTVSSDNSKRLIHGCYQRTYKPSNYYEFALVYVQLTDASEFLLFYQPSRPLRSSNQQLLQVPYMSTDFGRRAFSYSSPATWNSIPTSIKNCSSLCSFKRHLVSPHSPAHQQLTHSIWPPGDLPTSPIHA